MSEQMIVRNWATGFRACLLANVSSLALLGWVGMADGALAASAGEDHPVVWIELGGEFDRPAGGPEILSPPFFDQASPADRAVLTGVQQPALYSEALDGKIVFTPENLDWVLSAAVQYGRSSTSRTLHHQTAGKAPIPFKIGNPGKYTYLTRTPVLVIFGDAHGNTGETHTILNFQAGKDVGLGLFGARGSSVVSAGVRFAQFTNRSDAALYARPIYDLGAPGTKGIIRGLPINAIRHTYTAFMHSRRDTRALGPSLSWDASLPVAGDDSDASLSFDWGLNAAVLFGRQRAQVHHQTQGDEIKGFSSQVKYDHHYSHAPLDQNRSRNVMIPNVGGFAGLTFRYVNAKVSFGYRGDFFFGAMDGGIDSRKSETLGYYGPFATIAIGLGG